MIQNSEMRVLASFYSHETVSFIDICKTADYPSDLGGYYIRRLVRQGYLDKADRGLYRITPLGKQSLALHYGKKLSAPSPRLAVLLVCRHKGSYALLQRSVQPFIGRYEWPAGAVLGGESLAAAATRIAQDRVGLNLRQPLQAHGMFRRTDMYHDEVFDDKLFAVFAIETTLRPPPGHTSATGKLVLVDANELPQLPTRAKSLLDIWQFAGRSTAAISEHVYHLQAHDLTDPTTSQPVST